MFFLDENTGDGELDLSGIDDSEIDRVSYDLCFILFFGFSPTCVYIWIFKEEIMCFFCSLPFPSSASHPADTRLQCIQVIKQDSGGRTDAPGRSMNLLYSLLFPC